MNIQKEHKRVLPNFWTFILNGFYALISQWNDVKFKIFSKVLLNAQIFFQYFHRDKLFEWKHMRHAQKQECPRQDERVVDINFILLLWDKKLDEWKAKSRLF